jgi:hypothetical protein
MAAGRPSAASMAVVKIAAHKGATAGRPLSKVDNDQAWEPAGVWARERDRRLNGGLVVKLGR